jgi:hypothetical protein
MKSDLPDGLGRLFTPWIRLVVREIRKSIAADANYDPAAFMNMAFMEGFRTNVSARARMHLS